jgi:hypothetical protein
MITNFEAITDELTDHELSLIPVLVQGFTKHQKENPITAPDIVRKMDIYLTAKGINMKFSQPRLRKCVNYIRSNSIIPLIATSSGYYTSYDKEVISDQIKSLEQRARSIQNCATGLKKFIQ